jgi:hypothetical protein
MIYILIWAFIGHTFWLAALCREHSPADGLGESLVVMLVCWAIGPFAWVAWIYRDWIEDML